MKMWCLIERIWIDMQPHSYAHTINTYWFFYVNMYRYRSRSRTPTLSVSEKYVCVCVNIFYYNHAKLCLQSSIWYCTASWIQAWQWESMEEEEQEQIHIAFTLCMSATQLSISTCPIIYIVTLNFAVIGRSYLSEQISRWKPLANVVCVYDNSSTRSCRSMGDSLLLNLCWKWNLKPVLWGDM